MAVTNKKSCSPDCVRARHSRQWREANGKSLYHDCRYCGKPFLFLAANHWYCCSEHKVLALHDQQRAHRDSRDENELAAAKAYQKAYQEANRERLEQYQVEYRTRPETRERRRQYMRTPEQRQKRKEYVERNRERYCKLYKEYREAHRLERIEQKKRWDETNKDRVRAYRKEYQQRDYVRLALIAYREANRELLRTRQKAHNERRKTDPKSILASRIRSRRYYWEQLKTDPVRYARLKNAHVERVRLYRAKTRALIEVGLLPTNYPVGGADYAPMRRAAKIYDQVMKGDLEL